MPFAVRNLESGRAVFSDPNHNIAIEWQGSGDIDGNDIQQVPDELAQNVDFLRAVAKGVFQVEEASPEIEEALSRQSAAWRRKQEKARESVVASITEEAKNDIVSVPCIGPGQRGGACGEPVLVREKTKGERPPLCQRHSSLAAEYVMTETDRIIDGRAERKWSRMSVSAREHQQV